MFDKIRIYYWVYHTTKAEISVWKKNKRQQQMWKISTLGFNQPRIGNSSGDSWGETKSWEYVKPTTFFPGDMGLSENSVPLHPMVNDHYPY